MIENGYVFRFYVDLIGDFSCRVAVVKRDRSVLFFVVRLHVCSINSNGTKQLSEYRSPLVLLDFCRIQFFH